MSPRWLERSPLVRRLDAARALTGRPGLRWVETSGGRLRVRHQPCARGPRLVFAADGPNVLEHYDVLLEHLDGVADVRVVEPPGTGGSWPAPHFDYRLESFAECLGELVTAGEPCTLVFPCYLGFVAQLIARRHPAHVRRVVQPQTPSWAAMATWAERVDPRRLLRTPYVGQLVVAARRDTITRGWYRAALGASDDGVLARFVAHADEARAFGGCYGLASLMQAFERSAPPSPTPLPCPSAVVWGRRDRSHRGVDPHAALAGAEVHVHDHVGHSPELQDPSAFAAWVARWADGAPPAA